VAVRARGPKLVLPGLAAMSVAVMLGTGACSSSDDSDYYATCVDPQTHQVVDQSYCNEHPGYYIWMAPRHYQIGYTVPASARSGAGWFRADDTTARANAGLPETGDVPEGFHVSSQSGGFDGSHAGDGGDGGGDGGDGGGGDGGGGHGSGGE
jgi:hypothetical protein